MIGRYDNGAAGRRARRRPGRARGRPGLGAARTAVPVCCQPRLGPAVSVRLVGRAGPGAGAAAGAVVIDGGPDALPDPRLGRFGAQRGHPAARRGPGRSRARSSHRPGRRDPRRAHRRQWAPAMSDDPFPDRATAARGAPAGPRARSLRSRRPDSRARLEGRGQRIDRRTRRGLRAPSRRAIRSLAFDGDATTTACLRQPRDRRWQLHHPFTSDRPRPIGLVAMRLKSSPIPGSPAYASATARRAKVVAVYGAGRLGPFRPRSTLGARTWRR